jgi:hypothetical protein
MSSLTIAQRLKLNLQEVSGVITALEAQPTKAITPASLPLAYPRPMGMPTKIPGTSAGRYIVSRRWMIVCMVGLTQGATFDTSTEGSALLQKVFPFLDVFADYFMSHSRLKTASLADMVLAADVEYIDGGPEIFKAVDGQEYAGVRPILTIADIRSANRLS